MSNIETFRRVEQKYLLSREKYDELMNLISDHLKKDNYYKSKICNIYFDTNNYDLIINSLEKSNYKEKVRLRSYNTPTLNDNVFFEIKSKLDGVVYKRRVTIKLNDFYQYLNGNDILTSNQQIMKELDYTLKKYKLVPKYYIAYDRTSYYDKDDYNFRITFDENIRSRNTDLKLEYGDSGKLFFKEKKYIMELKSIGALPLWFTSILSELEIFPNSFSKYGNIYKEKLKEELLYV